MKSAFQIVLLGFAASFLSSCTQLSLDPESIQGMMTEALSHQVTQFSIAFAIAAWIHSGRVKKEIKASFSSIIASIDSVASALQKDLTAQSLRLGGVEAGINAIGQRVDRLEGAGNHTTIINNPPLGEGVKI